MKNVFLENEVINFEIHEPDEYEGKTIVINDSEYFLGKYLGSGNECFVHELVNKKSTLSLSAIKIWRDDIDSFKKSLENQAILQKRLADEDSSFVVPVIGFEQNGGAFFIQENLAGIDDEHVELIKKARDAVNKNNIDLGVEICNNILANNPFYTLALHLLAHINIKTEKPEEALRYFLKCANIEPTFLTYTRNAIRLSFELGQLTITKILFEQMKSVFQYNNQDDDVGALLYLNLGEPEMALNILTSHLEESMYSVHFSNQEIKEKSKQLLEIKSIAEKELENKASFHKLIKKAGSNIEQIKSAFELYDKDILPSLNYGIFLLKNNEYDFGINLLAKQIYKISQLTRRSCIANMAFFSIMNNKIEDGIKYLSYLANEIISSGIRLWDLPSIAEEYRKGEEILEHIPDDALQVIDEGIANYSKIHNNVPPEILTLRQIYKEHVDSYQK